MFEPAQLRSFLAVAETLSFTKAAERLGLAQPTVSQHVRKLEAAAKRVLVTRDTRDVRLTDNGDAMAGFARTILSAHDAASRYFSGSAMRGRLRFGTADDLAITGLPRILREFRQIYPQINSNSPSARATTQKAQRRPAGPRLREVGGRSQGRHGGPA